MESHGILKASKSTKPVHGSLTIRPNIPEIPGEEANRTVFFPEFHSDILGVPREVGLKFRKIGITGKFHSIRSFLLGPLSPSSEIELNMAASSFSCFYLTVLLDTIVMEWPQQALVSSAKIHVLACLSVFFNSTSNLPAAGYKAPPETTPRKTRVCTQIQVCPASHAHF